MKRRTVIAGTGAALSAIGGGCLGTDGEYNDSGSSDNRDDDNGSSDHRGDDNTEIEYQRCTKPFIPFSELPVKARNQVETAVEEGDYTTSEILYYPELVGEESALWIEEDNQYYEHRLEELSNNKVTLTFEEITPTRKTPAELKLSNQTEDSVTVSITISSEEDEVFTDEELTIDPAENINEVDDLTGRVREYVGEKRDAENLPGYSFPEKLQGYDVSVTLLGDESKLDPNSKTATVNIDPWFLYYWIQISEDEILMGTVQENDGTFTEHRDSKTGYQWECTQPPEGWPKKRVQS
ncbi:hypothetical protein [Natronosalvus vescus]|uniref:hypothetical protein n=1 Tax=Natronosalvus vescus TaxID=2953881 RepID=UPI00209048F4|nr:hypothetical protein [Natronosalvus vescus]